MISLPASEKPRTGPPRLSSPSTRSRTARKVGPFPSCPRRAPEREGGGKPRGRIASDQFARDSSHSNCTFKIFRDERSLPATSHTRATLCARASPRSHGPSKLNPPPARRLICLPPCAIFIPPPVKKRASARLAGFLQQAGRELCRSAATTTCTPIPCLGALSPTVRHRPRDARRRCSPPFSDRYPLSSAEKFVQRVAFWRTPTGKAWLEMRPGVWTELTARGRSPGASTGSTPEAPQAHLGSRLLGRKPGKSYAFEPLGAGNSSGPAISHNHARMWFASIWIFTLELPWELGADFFLAPPSSTATRHRTPFPGAGWRASYPRQALPSLGLEHRQKNTQKAASTTGLPASNTYAGPAAPNGGALPPDRRPLPRERTVSRQRAGRGTTPHRGRSLPLSAILRERGVTATLLRLRRTASQPASDPPRASSPSPTARFTMPPPGTATASAA